MNLRRAALTSLLVLSICSTLISVLAQQKQSDAPIKVQTALVSVPVIVSDHQGRYISGLRVGDFKLHQDRIEQPISFFDAAEEPLNVALLVDTSRSSEQVLGDIKKAASSFLQELRPQDRAMVVSFDYDVHVLSGLTSDRKELEWPVKDAKIGERVGTTLRDAVAEVIEHRFKRVEGRKAIILLTDGKDHGSSIDEQDLVDEAAESGALIYPIYFETNFPNRRFDRPSFPFPNRRRGWGRRDPFPPQRPGPDNRRRGRLEVSNEDAIQF